MTASIQHDDPRRLLTHASLYLWKQWRLYELAEWQDTLSILGRARHEVEEEDDALFLETLDAFLNDPNIVVDSADFELVA
jgi:hypothetical protein